MASPSAVRVRGVSPGRPGRRHRPEPLLVAHMGFAVGWLGLNAALLALGVVGLVSSQTATLRAVCVALGWLGLILIPPFSLGALATGVLVAVRGRWGLLRHWWVAAKLTIVIAVTFGANVVLDFRLQEAANRVTAGAPLTGHSLGTAPYEAVALPGVQMILLLTALVLSIYRPWGLTSLGTRQRGGSTT